MNAEQLRAIRIAEEVVKWCENIDSRATPGMFRVVLDIARHTGDHQRRIIERTGVSQSTGARTIGIHSGQIKPSQALNVKPLLDQYLDPEDRRQRVVDLTPAGKAKMHELMDRITPLLEKE